MAAAGFVHLHTHTQYSLLDGAARVSDLGRKAAELGMPALAMTDHGNLFGLVGFYRSAQEAGVKPIIGMETYVAPGSRHERAAGPSSGAYHLVLLARNEQGYRNLIQLASIGYLEGFYYKPRIDHEVLARHCEGLIGMSACLRGEVNMLARSGRMKEAAAAARRYADYFDGQFYLELMDHGLEPERLGNERLIELARDTGLPLVATNDVHYLEREHAKAHDVLLCIQTNRMRDDPKRMRFQTDQLYFRTPDEMAALFGHVPGALENSLRIAEACNVEIEFGKLRMPQYPLPEGFAGLDDYLEHLAWEGLRERYGEAPETTRGRLRYELDIIQRMGYAGYFLIVRDFIEFARQRRIPVGPGRGSAAGSLVSYCVGITNIDPIRYNLLFERFLNPERVNMPDIDVDFSDRGRAEVIRYVVDRYGAENVCQIITFGTMAARAVVRDVGRVLGFSYPEVDRIAKLIPAELKMTLEKALAQSPELAELVASDPRIAELIEIGRVLEGLTRHASTHAAGIVITPRPLTEHVPLFRGKEGEVTTQLDMVSCESMGLLKMDLLGLRTLTVVQDCLELLRQRGIEIDIESLPLDDPAVYDLMSRGTTVGVFQFESGGMVEYLKKLQPSSLEDLIAMNALHRPGPLGSGMVDAFIARKHGREEIRYEHGRLKPILEPTYGVIVYQEQVMEIASRLAGYSLGDADLLRRAMAKKKKKVMQEQRRLFVRGAQEREIPRKSAETIFELMDKFASYGFNRSHSAGYAVLAYQTAYLKAHHPVEFMAATLSSELNDSDRLMVLLAECRRMGIPIRPPDVQASRESFGVEGQAIRFALGAIKGLGHAAAQAVLQAREAVGRFRSFYHFCESLEGNVLNRKAMEALIAAGALDGLGGSRAQMMAALSPALERAAALRRDRQSGQASLFGAAADRDTDLLGEPALPAVAAWDEAEMLSKEKAALGFYLSHHPLDPYRAMLEHLRVPSVAEIRELPDRTRVQVAGVITQAKLGTTGRGEAMGIYRCEDRSGSIDLLVFGDALRRLRGVLIEDACLLLRGRIGTRDGKPPRLFGEDARDLARLANGEGLSLHLALSGEASDARAEALCRLLSAHAGGVPVFIHVDPGENHGAIVQLRNRCVCLDETLLAELENHLGKGNVRLYGGKTDALRSPQLFGQRPAGDVGGAVPAEVAGGAR
ncbi:MAG: DNA polymerase III subunit alpha [Candidatus Eisenbacteria bacterium]|nr:DNA polymerase III subunit alpha [Candidatus Eisenbacteria bacterium]